jgi:DNA-binding XRE family transcriptional regulator
VPPRRRAPADPVEGVEAMTQRILDEIALLEEPLERAQAATSYVHLLLAAKRRIALQRIAEVTELKRTSGLSQRDIAQALGVSGTVVAQVENEARGRMRRRRQG